MKWIKRCLEENNSILISNNATDADTTDTIATTYFSGMQKCMLISLFLYQRNKTKFDYKYFQTQNRTISVRKRKGEEERKKKRFK